MKKIWKPIKGYENLYEISNFGEVKSLVREWQVLNYKSNKLQTMKNKEKILKVNTSKTGYKQIILSKNHECELKLIHRLVAEAFIPNVENKPCVNHIDGNKANNCVDNLEWCTYKENNIHAWKLGLVKNHLKGKYGKESNKAKKVNQYDLQGNFIKTWDCISDVTRVLKIDCGRVTKCCQHKKYCHSAGGYKWEYSYRTFEERR